MPLCPGAKGGVVPPGGSGSSVESAAAVAVAEGGGYGRPIGLSLADGIASAGLPLGAACGGGSCGIGGSSGYSDDAGDPGRLEREKLMGT